MTGDGARKEGCAISVLLAGAQRFMMAVESETPCLVR